MGALKAALVKLRAEHAAWPLCRPDKHPYTYVYKRLGSNSYEHGYADYLIESLRARLVDMEHVLPQEQAQRESLQREADTMQAGLEAAHV